MTPWGTALEGLLARSGRSKGEAHRQGLTVKESFTKWKTSKRGPTVQILDRIIKGLGLSWQDWAEVYEGTQRAHRASAAKSTPAAAGIDDYVRIPLYDLKASAGHGTLIESERVLDELSFKRSWIKTKLKAACDHLGLLTVSGDSMNPTLEDGDIVLFDRGRTTISKDGIFVYIDKDEQVLAVKRLHAHPPDRIDVISDNVSRFHPRVLPASRIKVIGKVVWVARKL